MTKYNIHLQPDAIDDLDRIRKYDATKILDGLEDYLLFEPIKESRSRIKKLRGKLSADYRLRIDDWRIFYRIEDNTVFILRVLHKNETNEFYSKEKIT